MYKAADLDGRRTARLMLLDRQRQMQAKPPRVVTAALVLSLAAVETQIPADAPIHAVETKEVERRGVDLVLATERALGRTPVEQAFNHPGFDILSQRDDEDPLRIEVKARLAGAEDFFVTHNEVLTALNSAPRYRLALVRVDPRGAEHDDDPLPREPLRPLRPRATSTRPATVASGTCDLGTRPGAVPDR